MRESTSQKTLHAAAEAVQDACLRAALDGYESAGLDGLCEEGRWEMVMDSIRSLDVDAVLREFPERDRAAGKGGA